MRRDGRCVAGYRGVGFGTMNRRMDRMTAAVASVATVFVAASTAMGQADPPKPPPIGDVGSPPVIVYYLIGFVGLAICVALAAFPGRRAFED